GKSSIHSMKSSQRDFQNSTVKNSMIYPSEKCPAERNEGSAGDQNAADQLPGNVGRAVLIDDDLEHPCLDRPNRTATTDVQIEELAGLGNDRRLGHAGVELLQFASHGHFARDVPVMGFALPLTIAITTTRTGASTTATAATCAAVAVTITATITI